jgi:hypothetical protein
MTLEQLKSYILARAKTLADILATSADWAVMERLRYKLGEESFGWTYGRPTTPFDPNDHDCSGYFGSVLKFVAKLGAILGLPGNAMWPGGWKRPTARVFDAISEPVTDGSVRPGDCVIFQRIYLYKTGKRKGQIRYAAPAHHVVFVTRFRDGQWWTSEARHGTERNTLESVLGRRHAKPLRRIPGVELGEVTMLPALWPGDKGDEVRRLQERLCAHLGNWVTVDGEFGDETKYAVRTLQKLKSLKNTGKVGFDTWALLESEPIFRTLSYRAWGRDVWLAKKNLNRHGYDLSLASWTFWHYVEKAFADFQEKHGLPVTHQCDEATWKLILA